MTWIRTIPFDATDQLRQAREALRALYPIEYAEPTHPVTRKPTASLARTR